MDYEKVWDELLKMAKVDIDYQRGLESLIKKEKAYLAACEILTPEQKLVVEDYISACEELADYMILFAYRLGKRKE